MDEATKKNVEATVLEILRGSDMESVTEYKVRAAASDRLGIDLSIPDRKLFVRGVVEEYLLSLSSKEEAKAEEEGVTGRESKGKEQEEDEDDDDGEEDEGKGGGKREYDDQGDLILCRVSFFFLISSLALVQIDPNVMLGFCGVMWVCACSFRARGG
jgi:hypothetical protein